VNGSKARPDLLVHPSNKQKHRLYYHQFAGYRIYEYSAKAFIYKGTEKEALFIKKGTSFSIVL